MPGFQLVRPKTRAMSAPTITTPGSRSSVRLSLIIATYNRADYLPRTLNSLTNQSLGSELFEIIVVNNNSTDHTAEVCRSFAEAQPELNFTMVTEIRQGLSHARNCGINHAKGDYFAIIDDDELVNRDFLLKMKPSAMLINTSRGPVVVEQDLADALNHGVIAAAAVDVLSTEPPQADNPLLSARNIYFTPHIGWATKEARVRLLQIAEENLEAFVNGCPQNVVNL